MEQPWRAVTALLLTGLLIALSFALARSAVSASSDPETDATELVALAVAIASVGAALYGVTARR